MNIECITEKVDISSKCIQNMNTYKLGTQNFLDSVTTIEINYRKQKKNVFEDLNTAHEYFKNLKYVSVINITKAPVSYIVQILSQCNIDHISFSDTKDLPFSYRKPYQVNSEEGFLILNDTENTLTINFKNFSFSNWFKSYIIQDEYIVFAYEKVNASFDLL